MSNLTKDSKLCWFKSKDKTGLSENATSTRLWRAEVNFFTKVQYLKVTFLPFKSITIYKRVLAHNIQILHIQQDVIEIKSDRCSSLERTNDPCSNSLESTGCSCKIKQDCSSLIGTICPAKSFYFIDARLDQAEWKIGCSRHGNVLEIYI